MSPYLAAIRETADRTVYITADGQRTRHPDFAARWPTPAKAAEVARRHTRHVTEPFRPGSTITVTRCLDYGGGRAANVDGSPYIAPCEWCAATLATDDDRYVLARIPGDHVGHHLFRRLDDGRCYQVGAVWDPENFDTACDAADEEARILAAEAAIEFARITPGDDHP